MASRINTRDIENAASDAVRAISDAASKATAVIAQAAESAAKVVSNTAEAQAKTVVIPSQQIANDHDLIVKLDTKVDQIQLDVSELKKDKNIYVNQTEHMEVVSCTKDHETRIRSIESSVTKIMTWGSIILMILTLAQLALRYFVK